MWRHGLLLRYKPSFLIFKDPAVSLIIKTSYLNSRVYVKSICTKHLSILPSRSFSKVASVGLLLPESGLEVRPSELISDDTSNDQLGRPDSIEALKEKETDCEDKSSQDDYKAVLKGMVIEHNETDSDDQPIRPPRPRPSGDSKNDSKKILVEYSDDDDGRPVRKFVNDQEQMLFEAIEKKELTSEQWEEVRKQVLAAGKSLNEHNLDASIISICMSHKQLSTGLSYINYLSASTQELNVATISKFLKLSFICSEDINDDIRIVITSLYDSLRTRYPTLDATTAENVLHGLSVTQRWKEGLDILDEIRLTCSPNASTYSALIKASFDNDEPDIGWELMSKMLLDNRKPLPIVYESWLQYCRRSAAGNKTVEQQLVDKLLYFFASNDIRLTENIVKIIRLWFEYDAPPEADWNVEFTSVDTRGMCKSCNQFLKPIAVSKTEFELLRSVFIDKTVVGSNIFLKSTPEELEEYQDFVKKTAPYDVVIDGLNVGYSSGAGKGNPRTYGRMLKSVVQHFVSRSQKVLVLGRRHMNKWPQEYMDYVYENAEVFLAQNLSQDDPYLLYAAMYSGLGTFFISRDLMRSHAFILKDPKLQAYFRRWQKQHQYQVLHIGDDGHVRFRLPQKINTSTQRNRNGCWHIPYDLEYDSSRNQDFNPPRQWLCLSHYAERGYNDGFENNSSQFTNNRYENRGYGSNNEHPQFRKTRDHRFDDSDGEELSQFQKKSYVDRRFDDDSKSRFRKYSKAEERFDDDDDDDEDAEEKEQPRYRKGRPRQEDSTFDDDESTQFRNSRSVDQRFGGERESRDKVERTLHKPYRQIFDYERQSKGHYKPKLPPVHRMLEDLDSDDDNDKQRFSSKHLSLEEKLKEEMFESESKQAFRSNRSQRHPVRKEDD